VRTVRQSCHSLAELAQRCAAHMGRGGTMLSICESNAADAARHPALLGPLRAAQASTVRYLAQALAPQQIRVHALAPDPALSQDGLAMLHQVDKGLALLAAGPWRGPRPAAGPAEPGRAASAPHAANA
jgi:enoyl-[acyl-carrier-protein] reductase (NADH)